MAAHVAMQGSSASFEPAVMDEADRDATAAGVAPKARPKPEAVLAERQNKETSTNRGSHRVQAESGEAKRESRRSSLNDIAFGNQRHSTASSPRGSVTLSGGRSSKRNRKTVSLRNMMEMDDLREAEDDDDLAVGWTDCRKRVCFVLTWKHAGSGTVVFDAVMGLIVMANIALMIPATDLSASCELDSPELCIPLWMDVVDYTLLAIYTIELAMRVFVYRCGCFRSPWILLDMLIVGLGMLGLALAGAPDLKRVNILRVLRVARILRFIRILKSFPTLCNMVGGFVGAMQAMAWGILMILLLIVAWSLFAVEFIHPINMRLNAWDPARCEDAFKTVLRSTLLFFQTLVAGDSWGACAIPIIEQEPWTYGIFAGALVTVQLGFTNLVLAIIVDKAAEAREGSKDEQREQRMRQQVESFEMWREAMGEIDADSSGTISEEELMAGYENPRVKETLEDMNITKQDLRSLFHMMDQDGSGQLSYNQLLDSFYKAQVQDPKIYLMVMQLRMQKVETQVRMNHQSLKSELQNSIRELGREMREAVRETLSDVGGQKSAPASDFVVRATPSVFRHRPTVQAAAPSTREHGGGSFLPEGALHDDASAETEPLETSTAWC